jgi:hypothetical protein
LLAAAALPLVVRFGPAASPLREEHRGRERLHLVGRRGRPSTVRRTDADTAHPGALVGVDKEPVDGVMIWLVGQVPAEYRMLELCRLRVQAGKDVGERELAPSDLGGQQLLALMCG